MDIDNILVWRPPICIHRSHTEDQILQQLKSLRAKNLSTELDFTVENISWTERIGQEMILTFEHFVNSGRQWKKAIFYVDQHPETSVHLHSVLQAPATTQLFGELFFSGNQLNLCPPMGIQFATALAFVLRNGRRVIVLNFLIGNDAMSALSDGLVTRAGDVGPQELELIEILFLNNGVMSEERSEEQCLANGFALNTTLTTFRILEAHSSDSTLAMIVRSLIGHPSLRELGLRRFECGELTTRAICCLLASSTCKVSDLRLSYPRQFTEEGAAFDVQRFIEQLPVNSSIQSLELSSFEQSIDHDSANQLLRSLWKFPNLKLLKLTGNAIEDFLLLTSGLTMTTPHCRLRVLDLDQYRLDDRGQSTSEKQKTTRAILGLLEVFPELGHLGDDVARKFPSVIERMDLNRCSGMLLRGAEIPLSVWAVVLAKVNTDPILKYSSTTSRKANVFYHMLHGPVFAGRGPLGSETDRIVSLD